jgi:hypothetical protein
MDGKTGTIVQIVVTKRRKIMWSITYGSTEWKETDQAPNEQKAKQIYEQHCKNPPMRGGKKARYVALYDDSGKYVAGFASNGKYGKI